MRARFPRESSPAFGTRSKRFAFAAAIPANAAGRRFITRFRGDSDHRGTQSRGSRPRSGAWRELLHSPHLTGHQRLVRSRCFRASRRLRLERPECVSTNSTTQPGSELRMSTSSLPPVRRIRKRMRVGPPQPGGAGARNGCANARMSRTPCRRSPPRSAVRRPGGTRPRCDARRSRYPLRASSPEVEVRLSSRVVPTPAARGDRAAPR